jgi:molybdopterin converting factor small subunit
MEVTVLFFGAQRDVAGTPNAVVELDEGSTLETLRSALIEAIPEVESFADPSRFAVNGNFAPLSHSLTHGDEIAIVTMVSGG